MHAALRVITETFTAYAIGCLEQGASGIFYATNGWASKGMLTADQYREFGEQYDLEFLDAIKSRSKFNILHNCGTHIYFDQLANTLYMLSIGMLLRKAILICGQGRCALVK